MYAESVTYDQYGRVCQQFDGTGRPIRNWSRDLGATTVQDLRFTFDVIGNLKTRQDLSRNADGSYKSLTETFTYDRLNRLQTVKNNGTTMQSRSYFGNGNIKTHSAHTRSYVYGTSLRLTITLACCCQS